MNAPSKAQEIKALLAAIVAFGTALWGWVGWAIFLLIVTIFDGRIPYGNYITLIVTTWYFFTEVGSILENIKKLGAPIPDWLITGARVLKGKAEEAAPIVKTGDPPSADKTE